MFLDFFYMLRACGLPVSPVEWMSLMQALELGLVGNSLTRFYEIARVLLCRNEKDYDAFDIAFLYFFEGIESSDDLLANVREWLSQNTLERDKDNRPDSALYIEDLKDLLDELKKRLEEQTEKHDGGNYWVGTGGTSPFGHSGYNPHGIRLGGQGRLNSAVKVAADRRFRDFREDEVLGVRQFQMAFRRLRQYSSRVEEMPDELDVQASIDATCDNAGILKLVYGKPRKNTVKVLLLMDSGGSMNKYTVLCGQLFQALRKSNHFKDLQVFYFHNCIYDDMYLSPECRLDHSVKTMRVLNTLDNQYRVVLLGDAEMAPSELSSVGGILNYHLFNEVAGIDWLRLIDDSFEHKVWLNPQPSYCWDMRTGAASAQMIRQIFPMFELTVAGVSEAITELLS